MSHAINGVRLGLSRDRNLRIHSIAALAMIMVGLSFDFNRVEWILLLLTMALVIVAEFMNTAIEILSDSIHPRLALHIQRLKDVSAAGVLCACLAALIIGILLIVGVVESG